MKGMTCEISHIRPADVRQRMVKIKKMLDAF